MKENISPESANPVRIAAMTKPEIVAALENSYSDAKPLNDHLVDISLRCQAITAEIYRRSIAKQLPKIPIGRRRTVMRIECSVPPRHGLPQLAKRLLELDAEGVKIAAVEYDENTAMFTFFAAPEFELPPVTTQPSVAS